ncbi:MAG: molybdopterin molybdotransferase MoeA [Nevskiales bacterium]|nr:molybdopterin molybdotransferase MoeA [Nevskiales bacterium]
MIPVEEALRRISGAGLRPLPGESVPLLQALGRVLAEPARAARDRPRVDQSAMDGYAVRAVDLENASLLVAGVVAATGHDHRPQLPPGTALRIFTGGLLPENADTVVRQEWTVREGDRLRVPQPVAAGSDVRRQAEELSAGTVIADAGARLTPGLLAALAMAGVEHVFVHRTPRLALLMTGDEVVPLGTPLRLGQVPDANGPLLSAWLRTWGCTSFTLAYVPDRVDAVRESLDRALQNSDLVITTGGVSVGDLDYVPAAAETLGAERILWKVAQKPGMPLYVAQRHGVPLFGLPGNPASVLVNLLSYVRRGLDVLEGLSESGPHFYRGRLAQAVRADAAKHLWLRMKLLVSPDGSVVLRNLPRQSSHMLSNLAEAQALVLLPPAPDGWPGGTEVSWLPL